MFERFTDRARTVMVLANSEAESLNHEYIGTEHILLGLVKEGSGVGANVLKNLDINLEKVRLELGKIIKNGPDSVTMAKLPQTPATKKVIIYAIEEARALGHNYVGTEHLLLGLLREDLGVAAQVLCCLGLNTEEVREEVLNLLGASYELKETRLSTDPTKSVDETTSAIVEKVRRGNRRVWVVLGPATAGIVCGLMLVAAPRWTGGLPVSVSGLGLILVGFSIVLVVLQRRP